MSFWVRHLNSSCIRTGAKRIMRLGGLNLLVRLHQAHQRVVVGNLVPRGLFSSHPMKRGDPGNEVKYFVLSAMQDLL